MIAGSKSLCVLIVEDDPGHARLIEKNLRRGGVVNEIVKLGGGQEALDYLFGADAGAAHRVGALLVLLDLNMQGVGGIEILTRMKQDPATRRIPVIILTTTDDPREIERCYELGCNVYVTKPVDYDKFSQAIQQLGIFVALMAVPDAG